jgi:ATP sulfurylase
MEKQKHDKGHKKHKKEKKHKKSKHRDGAEDLDQLLAAKFSKLKQIMDKKELQKVLEEEKNMKKSRKRSRSPSSEDERPRKKEYGLVVSY